MTTIESIQTVLAKDGYYHGAIDGDWGPLSQNALHNAISTVQASLSAPTGDHAVIASSFADPADVAAFRRCKATGKSDQECFKVGDNGIGKWGDDCTGPTPMCALPPEDWEQFGSAARGKLVQVAANGRTVICQLRDTMPHKANITNGAGLDLNEAAVSALGLQVPLMTPARWSWV